MAEPFQVIQGGEVIHSNRDGLVIRVQDRGALDQTKADIQLVSWAELEVICGR